jgi:hypothetical protein
LSNPGHKADQTKSGRLFCLVARELARRRGQTKKPQAAIADWEALSKANAKWIMERSGANPDGVTELDRAEKSAFCPFLFSGKPSFSVYISQAPSFNRAV